MVRWGLSVLVLAAVLAGCGDDDNPPRPTPTPTIPVSATATASVAGTATVTLVPTTATVPTHTPGPLSTATRTSTLSDTPTPTSTPTSTSTPQPPEILLFGLARADDLVQEPDTHDAVGRPVYIRSQGQGMMLFVEARRGASRLEESAYDPDGFAPGVEIIASRPLGDGSPAVCDYNPPIIGGVPAVDPFEFTDSDMVRDAIEDLGCRFNDGTGEPRGRTTNSACTRDAGALYSFVTPTAELQYCLPIAKAWSFPIGDTIVAARVRDSAGRVSATSEIVIRVVGDQPFDCTNGLGERDFLPRAPASRLVVDAQGQVSLDTWAAEPLRVCAGPDVGGGVHALNLREDATLGIPLVDGETLCVRFRSRGSDGVLDCGNSTPQDVRAIANEDTGRITVDSGLGIPAGTGSASLRLPVSFLVLPSGSSPSDCADGEFGSSINDALTTATATAEVIDGRGMTVASLVRVGAPFDCARWPAGGDAPVWVLPIPTVDPIAGSVAATLVLVE